VPISRSDTPIVSDALFTLRAGVQLETCSMCECDVNGDGLITVIDALTVLRLTVGLDANLECFVSLDTSVIDDDGAVLSDQTATR